MTSRRKTVLAILIAPSAAPLLMLGAQSLFAGKLPAPEPALVYLCVSYVFSYTMGVPIYLLARRRRWRTALQYMAGGFLMGLAATLAVAVPAMIWAFFGAGRPLGTAPLGLIIAIPIGVLTTPIGLLFWFMTRPDLSSQAPLRGHSNVEAPSRVKLIIKVALWVSLPLSAGGLFGVFSHQQVLMAAFMLALFLLVVVAHIMIFLVSVPRPKVSPYTLMLYLVGLALVLLCTAILPASWRPSWLDDHQGAVLIVILGSGWILTLFRDRRRKSPP
jgi:hypothetical protein